MNLKHKLSKYFNPKGLLISSFLLLSLSLLLFIPNDPDFFWHLKLGEITNSEGPVEYDPFSYSFREYEFIDFEWLSHSLIYSLYSLGGLYLVSLIYGLIVFLALFLSLRNPLGEKAPLLIKSALLLIAIIVIKPIIGVRPQMLSLLGFSLTYFILTRYLKYKSKSIFLLPLIFLIWANAHPGFLSGLVLMGIILFVEILKAILRKFNILKGSEDSLYKDKFPSVLTLMVITGFSFLATLITPYFHRILTISIEFGFDSYAMDHIQEWLTPNFHHISGKFFILFIVTSLIAVFKKKNVNLTEIVVLSVFAVMAFQCVRHTPLYIIVAIPSLLSLEYKKVMAIFDVKSLFLKFTSIIILLASILAFFYQIYYFVYVNSDLKRVYDEAEYPYDAVDYLKTMDFKGNLFNNYGWGGFLILEYPEKKVFIDGRMASWKIKEDRILEIYEEISNLSINNWEEKLSNYNVKVALLDKEAPLTNALINSNSWEKEYEDEYAIILRKE